MSKRTVWAMTMAGLITMGCNQHPVSYTDELATTEVLVELNVDGEENLDVLWVIDNSGSMCEEQAILRENFDRFVEELDGTNLDFHIGVTTTHMDEGHPLEPVAIPGHLQSQPQPLVGYDDTCFTAKNNEGESIAGDYTPVRQLIDIAVDCMAAPDQSYVGVSDAEIECALYNEPAGCEIPGRCGPGGCEREDLFPPLDSARQIPKVLRSADYRRADNTLDVERLQSDFACMATVGMRGYGFEKGLGAAVAAVSPELTGGAVGAAEADAAAPNHGLIRDDARFAVVFVTDENDCTHDGSLTERAGQCGDDTCDFWNHPAVEADSPLLSPEVLRDQLLENLRLTKGDADFDLSQILVASIHGNSARYSGDVIPSAECRVSSPDQPIPSACGAMSVCDDPSYQEVSTTCSTALGTAYSGDRYDRFLRTFEETNYFPRPANPGDPIFGWMCTGDFRPALSALGSFFRTLQSGCITEPLRRCEGPGAACPAFAHSGEPGNCMQRGSSEEWFCDSFVEVRVTAGNGEALDRLRATGFCHPDSFGTPENPGGCVVEPSRYAIDTCNGLDTGVYIAWNDLDQARRALAGTELELRFASSVSTSGR